MIKKKTLKEFKKFLAENCWDERIFGEGRYDRKIFDWFKKNRKSLKIKEHKEN